ncbi:MAG: NnrS family protein, partial [Rhodobacteraceae bacterium]|nr:NnrS family protein [Paracoccaceae bacterium]
FGRLELAGPFAPVDWHIHEALFGYTSAVITGFLFTAVPNWTGRTPQRGWSLGALALLWLAGRLAVAGLGGLGPVIVLLLDVSFMFIVLALIIREIIAGKNWRNMMVAVPVGLFGLANLGFHFEVIKYGGAQLGWAVGFAVVIFLIMLIGGRVIPAFTRNWLKKQGATALPAAFGKFDGAALAVGAVALLVWAFVGGALAGALLIIAGIVHLARLSRWQGRAIVASPLLLMLHMAYLMIPVGLLALGASEFGLFGRAAGLHLLGIGAVGGTTCAVMMRATLGHSGRPLVAGRALTLGFVLIIIAALMRAGFGGLAPLGISGLIWAGGLWTLGYGLILVRLMPMLVAPKI